MHISMDGKERWMNNVFIEKVWRSATYEYVELHPYDSIADVRQGPKAYFSLVNKEYTNHSHARQTTDEVYFADRLRKAV